jgi:hypothetical protein
MSEEEGTTLTASKTAVFHLAEMSWNWHHAGQLVARGKLEITRDIEVPPAVIAFEIPIADPPPRGIFDDPQDWVIALLRRTMRA